MTLKKIYYKAFIIFWVIATPCAILYAVFFYKEIGIEKYVYSNGQWIVGVNEKRSIESLKKFKDGININSKNFYQDSIHISSGSKVKLIDFVGDSSVAKIAIYSKLTGKYSFPVYVMSSDLSP